MNGFYGECLRLEMFGQSTEDVKIHQYFVDMISEN